MEKYLSISIYGGSKTIFLKVMIPIFSKLLRLFKRRRQGHTRPHFFFFFSLKIPSSLFQKWKNDNLSQILNDGETIPEELDWFKSFLDEMKWRRNYPKTPVDEFWFLIDFYFIFFLFSLSKI